MTPSPNDLKIAKELLASGNASGALARFKQALRITPHSIEIMLGVITALRILGQHSQAAEFISFQIRRLPSNPVLYRELGVCYLFQADFKQSAIHLASALVCDPANDKALGEFGTACQAMGDRRKAAIYLERAYQSGMRDLRYINNHAAALVDLAEYSKALDMSGHALRIHPESAEALANRSAALIGLGRPDEAVGILEQCVKCHPDFQKGRGDLIDVLMRLSRFDRAFEIIAETEARGRQTVQTALQKCSLLAQVGEIDMALDGYRMLMAMPQMEAHFPELARGLLSGLPYSNKLKPEQLLMETKSALARIRFEPMVPIQPPGTTARTGRRVRVGYLSGDFRQHSVARNLLPVLANHNKSEFECHLYADVRAPDSATDDFARLADRFTVIAHLSDRALAEKIRLDNLDILVLLAGRFDTNRIFLGQYRMAPIQISFHDVGTTGLDQVDYLVSDPTLSPKHSPEKFSERIVRLPRFYVHDRMDGALDPGPLPMLSQNNFTFGSFNNPAKFNADVLALWGRVIDAVPGSRLMLKYKDFYSNANLQKHILARLGAVRPVDPARVIFHSPGIQTVGDHLALYRHVDLCLDTFPFSGSTTTFESLCMGVPVITLPQFSMVSRWSQSILEAVKLETFVARSPDDYIDLAVEWAGRSNELSQLRAGLRARVNESSVTKGNIRACQLERLYKALYQRHMQ